MSNPELEKMYQEVKKTIVLGCAGVGSSLVVYGRLIESPAFALNSLYILFLVGSITVLIWLAEIWDYGRALKR